MASRTIDICDAIVTEINTALPSAASRRSYAPVIKAGSEPQEIVEDIADRQVVVIPRTRGGQGLEGRNSRTTRAYDHQVTVGIYKRVEVDIATGEPDTSEVDALVEFVEQIEDHFETGSALDGIDPKAIVIDQQTVVFDFEAMRDNREFRSFITITIRQAI